MIKQRRNRTVMPRQERAIQTRARIVAAAAAEFAARGPDGARIEDIARRADVNRQRIYAYFGSKEGLYRHVLINVYNRAADDARLLSLEEADIPRMTAVLVAAFFEIHEDDPTFWRLLSWENLRGGDTLRPEDWAAIRGGYLDHLRGLFRQGQAAGILRRDLDFSSYMVLLFSVTYFCHSNRLTLSRLLGVPLQDATLPQEIEAQLATALETAVQTAPPIVP